MKTWGLCGMAVLALGASARPAHADAELDQLRTQNAQLKAQIEALQRACPTAAAQPVPASPAPTSVTAPSVPATPPPAASMAAPMPAGAPSTATVAPPAPSPQVPEGYKLVKIDPETEVQDAENCAKGLFSSTKDAPWKHEQAWEALSKNMSPRDVDTALGSNHTNVSKGDRTLWEYGKCSAKSAPQAYVVFDHDGLLFWQRPDF